MHTNANKPIDGNAFVVADHGVDGHTGILLDEIGDELHLRDHLLLGDIPNVMRGHIARPDPVLGLAFRGEKVVVVLQPKYHHLGEQTYVRMNFVDILKDMSNGIDGCITISIVAPGARSSILAFRLPVGRSAAQRLAAAGIRSWFVVWIDMDVGDLHKLGDAFVVVARTTIINVR